jgi:DNA-binding transcriptional LysR family regulator
MGILDTDLLRTFVAFADSGSLARAADSVGRTPSAVTAQMQRLEAQIGAPLLEASGRGRTLTPAGAELLVHARRILSAHRDALFSLKGSRADGRVTLGSTQDFADSTLPDLLRAFVKTHPRIRLDLRIGRSSELTAAFDQGVIDIALTMRAKQLSEERAVLREPIVWLCASSGFMPSDELPLALLDPPCGFRDAAIAALDAAERRYRIAATSPSLSGLRVAVRAGIAISARTRHSLEPGIQIAPRNLALPKLPHAEFGLRVHADANPAASDLASTLSEGLTPSRAHTRK